MTKLFAEVVPGSIVAYEKEQVAIALRPATTLVVQARTARPFLASGA